MIEFVYGVLWDEHSASDAVEALENEHFEPRDITVLIPAEHQVVEVPLELQSGVPMGAAIGAMVGAVVGAIAAYAAQATTASALGALAIAYGSIVAGAAIGALAGLGFWKDKIQFPREHQEHGDVVVGVSTRERVESALEALREAGARDIGACTKAEALEQLRHQLSAA
jgi:hypothetical protein